jgi:bifunctional DNase/RNase
MPCEGRRPLTVSIRAGEDAHEVDACPSDALNLAVRLGCPTLVDSVRRHLDR